MKLIPFTSEESKKLVQSTNIRLDLIESFCVQRNNCRCGLACAEIVLVASKKVSTSDDMLITGIVAPIIEKKPLNSGRSIRDIDDKGEGYGGISLPEVQGLLARFFNSNLRLDAVSSTIDQFIEWIVEGVKSEKYLIAHFDASILGLNLNGHYCVVGAYNEDESLVLLVDPARHRHGWHWVKVEDLFTACQSIMKSTNTSRGLVLVHD